MRMRGTRLTAAGQVHPLPGCPVLPQRPLLGTPLTQRLPTYCCFFNGRIPKGHPSLICSNSRLAAA